MEGQRVPFDPDDQVRPKAGVHMPVRDNYTVDAVMLGRDGWKVLLAGLHIGYGGWLPAEDFEKVERPADQFPFPDRPELGASDPSLPDDRFSHG
ncbi:MAG: hypothetical protein Q7S50_04185 [bacterium]|nr:hypothetical protein [bacterium]